MNETNEPEQNRIHIPSRIFDIILMSIFTFLCSLPIVTFGASITALAQSVRHILADEFFEPGTFFHYFRKTWKTSTAVWVLILIASGILVLDFRLVLHMTGLWKVLVLAGLICILCCVCILFVSSFLLLSSEPELSPCALLPRAFLTGVGKLPRTLLVLALAAIPPVFFFISPTVFWVISPFWILAWPASSMFAALRITKL